MDLEVLKSAKPNAKHLSLAVFQKCIFDIINGIQIATAAGSLYMVFDFMTFVETSEQKKSGAAPVEFKFTLEGNAKLALMLFTSVQLIKLVTYFFFEILGKVKEYSGFVRRILRNEAIINISFLLVIFAVIVMNCIEEYHTADQKVKIGITSLFLSQIILSIANELGSKAVSNQITLIMGSQEILMSCNPHSPSHSNLHGGAETTGEPLDIFREKYYYRYLCYLRYFDF